MIVNIQLNLLKNVIIKIIYGRSEDLLVLKQNAQHLIDFL